MAFPHLRRPPLDDVDAGHHRRPAVNDADAEHHRKPAYHFFDGIALKGNWGAKLCVIIKLIELHFSSVILII